MTSPMPDCKELWFPLITELTFLPKTINWNYILKVLTAIHAGESQLENGRLMISCWVYASWEKLNYHFENPLKPIDFTVPGGGGLRPHSSPDYDSVYVFNCHLLKKTFVDLTYWLDYVFGHIFHSPLKSCSPYTGKCYPEFYFFKLMAANLLM